MSHLTERTILELRDGVPVDADASAHLDECAVCRTALEEAEARKLLKLERDEKSGGYVIRGHI